MTDALQWGLDIVVWIQQYRSPVVDEFMRHITDLGGDYYPYFLPLLLWSLNFRFMVRVCTMLALSFFLNISCKDLLTLPRPFDIDPSITPNREWGYGLPSGHSQNSALLWVMLARSVAKRWFWALAMATTWLIGFSRIYFGLHFPGDIVAGWLLASGLLGLYVILGERSARWLNRQSTAFLTGALWLLCGVLFLFYACLLDMPLMAGMVAISLGAGTGSIVTLRYLRYSGCGNLWHRVIRSAIGLGILFGYIKATGGLLSTADNGDYYQTVFAVYTVAGLWLTLGAPALFLILSLAGRPTLEQQIEG